MAAETADDRFARWFREHQGLLWRITRTFAVRREDQPDLFQELLLQLWLSARAFAQQCKESTWIYRVGLNTAMAWQRGELRRPRIRLSLHGVEASAPPEPDRLCKAEALQWLYDQIHQLPPAERSLILLHLEGASYHEISEVIGLSESNVGAKLTRIRQRMTEARKETGHGV